ncbi:P-loop NTPase fold protein [Rhodococcus sp. KRD175]|uniref:KAP family P-loop NTPase fold protein n=1 Tax=Rhodococcus sp. KRD175 TaxID=2729729 RepID=UPI0019D1E1FF|nr:P-loop NTPase fold protein [Rhodococcus sp. KRD175]
MWADNETNLDLLGFDFLVDGLVVALTEPRLLPLTIGVLGDWGSGKSSLMRIAAQELDDIRPEIDSSDEELPSPYLTVHFSPWQYEDHDDVKIALMTTVLDEIAKRVPDAAEQLGRLRSIVAGLRRWGRRLGRAGSAAAPTVVPILLQAASPDMDPGMAENVTALAGVVATQAGSLLHEPGEDASGKNPNSSTPRGDVDAFRQEFAELVQAIPQCAAVVVFIDDLDRCLPETVVDTFEAIRLFLNTPKTAYVLALNQNVVESAIDSRYPELKKADGAGIGRDYLEKMLQLKIAIPPLSEPEAETYINLLFADLHLPPDDFAGVLDKAAKLRRTNGMEVAFNIGIAGTVLADIPEDLVADLKWAGDISPILGASLRGNPRQLKRFLNNLLLKYRSAQRRRVELKLPILAKLMVLEDQYNTDFQKLFDWEMAAGGACTEIGVAEARARGARENAESTTTQPADNEPKVGRRSPAKQPTDGREGELHAWADKAHIADWLTADPPLAGTDLRSYFTYSRDKLSYGVSASRLVPHLQRLLTDIQSEIEVHRRDHYAAVNALDAGERMQLIEALLARVQRAPSSVATTAALELAEKNADIVTAVCEALLRLPPTSIRFGVGSAAVRRLPAGNAAVEALLQRWADGDNTQLAAVVRQARASAARKR